MADLVRFLEEYTMTLAVDLVMSENVIIEMIRKSGSDLLNTVSNLNELEHSLLTQASCLPIYAHKPEVVGSRIGRSAFVDILLSLKPNDSFTVTSIHLETRISTRKPSTLPISEPGSARKIHHSGEVSLYRTRVKVSWSITSDLEQNHNLGGRRSGSCETIGSANSFRTDSVVDWGELLYGYNQ